MPPRLPDSILVLANGEPPSKALALALARRSRGVLCTDGAYATALKLGLKPRWVVGDMDSLPGDLRIGPGTLAVFDDDPDCSDFEKAAKFLVKFGYKHADVLGAFGRRSDHALTALSVALKYASKISFTFQGPLDSTVLLNKGTAFKARRGQTFSLIPVDNPSWVSVAGARYPISRQPLFAGSRGQSNEAGGGLVTVVVHSGKVWLVRARR